MAHKQFLFTSLNPKKGGTIMVSFRKQLVWIGVVAILAPAAFAQTSGTITVTGTDPVAVSLTDTSEGTLSTSIALGTLTPANNNTLALTDIGFGVTSMTLTGTNVANSGSRTDAIASGFNAATWPTPANGLTPSFTKTLNNITGAGAQVLNGSRISTKGNLATSDNYISVYFGIATLPQF